VLLARTGQAALDTLHTHRVHLILLDLMMPGMDGLTFLAERRRLRIAEGIPIICLSAAASDMLAQALLLGARECLQKPADFDQLCDRVEYYCAAA
jgi:DNA-binding response OmpR family regulator